MVAKDTSQIKQKIIATLNSKGPSLPVHIANEIGMSILFASAFLSELLSEKKIKISYMKVGSSPIYFIAGQESKLENYSHYLKSREKDAYELLKENKFLKDEKQEPAIRVALRAIKDFAFPFRKDEKIYWRYLTAQINEFETQLEQPQVKKEESVKNNQDPESLKKIAEEMLTKEIISPLSVPQNLELGGKENQPTEKTINQESPKELDIFDQTKKESVKPKSTAPKPIKKKAYPKKASQKKNEKFFDKVKEFLEKQSIEITGIEGFNDGSITLKIKKDEKEQLLIAYNKKRITEIDLANAYKKALEQNLEYIILSLGDTSKKLKELIEAIKNLDKIDKIE